VSGKYRANTVSTPLAIEPGKAYLGGRAVLRLPWIFTLTGLVHIVDDDAQVRAATSFLLANHGYSTEIYSSGPEFLRDAKLKRGCILLDLAMPEMSGNEVQEQLIRRGVTLPVIVMGGPGDLAATARAMKLGASDLVEKPPPEEELLTAVGRCLQREAQAIQRREGRLAALARIDRLSPRERQILQGLLAGLANKEIARRLHLSPRTVEMHRAGMMEHLGTSSLADALRLGIYAELAPLG
jgi:FixJ family two-component response regulator